MCPVSVRPSVHWHFAKTSSPEVLGRFEPNLVSGIRAMRPRHIMPPVLIRHLWGGSEGTNNPQISLFIQKYSCSVECTENTMRAFGACLDTRLCLAWQLTPVRGLQRAFPYFSIGHLNVFFSRTIRRSGNQFPYDASEQWGLVMFCSTSGSAPPKGLRGQYRHPRSGIFFKNFLVRNRPNGLKFIWGLLKHVFMLRYGAVMEIGPQ